MTTVLILLIFNRHAESEGFTAELPTNTKPKGPNPQEISHNLLKTVMIPIRRLTGIVTSPAEWKERFEMAQMTPTEIARSYLKKQGKQ